MKEKQVFFKGREVFHPKGWPDEIIGDEGERIKRDRIYTDDQKRRHQLGKGIFTKAANKYAFRELLVSEVQERPGFEPNFPATVTIPDRYPINYAIIKEFVPEKRLEEGINMLFLSLRLNSIGLSAEHQNKFGLIISEEKLQFIKKLNDFEETLNQTKENSANNNLRQLVERGQRLEREKLEMFGEINNYEQEQERIIDRQLMKETPDIDSIASMMLIDSMLSGGVNKVQEILRGVQELSKKDRRSVHLAEEIILYLSEKYPYAHIKKLEKLVESYIKIGGEISHKFDE